MRCVGFLVDIRCFYYPTIVCGRQIDCNNHGSLCGSNTISRNPPIVSVDCSRLFEVNTFIGLYTVKHKDLNSFTNFSRSEGWRWSSRCNARCKSRVTSVEANNVDMLTQEQAKVILQNIETLIKNSAFTVLSQS